MKGKFERKPDEPQIREKKQNRVLIAKGLWKWLVGAVVLAVLMLNLFTHILQIVNYNGTGMEPTLRGGQTLVIQKTQKVREGDIIAFYYNNQVLVRRVICEGGKQLEIDDHGTVRINGAELPEPYLKSKSLGQSNVTFPLQVRSGTVFVMGDNRAEAMDSRLEEIGTVPMDRIIGKVILTL